jgi:predicted esterase
MKVPSAVCLGLVLALTGAAAAAPPPTGFQDKVQISSPTRLDWKFAASAFGSDAAKLPADYDSRRQHYQLFVPRDYDPTKSWPLVVFISPGDDPLGWRHWQKTCEKASALFCAPYAAGNSCPVGQRTRIILDMLDDVRRAYKIDPDQTYLTGLSGGGRMACTIAFALPEYFGGVAPVCGTNPLPRLDAVRHRVKDRLSVAFITGESDFNRKENEAYMAPMFADLGIRSKLWVVPKMGHAMPPSDLLSEVYAWLAADLKHRREDAKAHPGLAVPPGETPAPEKAAAGQVEEAVADLKKDGRTWRGVSLLRAAVERWPNTDAGDKARQLLKDVVKDEAKARAIEQEGGKDESEYLTAQAKALERFGDARRAAQAWQALAKGQPDTPEGKKAAEEVKRLREAVAATPYLGIGFGPNGLLVTEVARRGPADKAGLTPGDRLLKVGGAKVTTQEQVRQALAKHKPGDKLDLEIERGGKSVTLSAEVGSPPVEE